jgi:hypothetical protein
LRSEIKEPLGLWSWDFGLCSLALIESICERSSKTKDQRSLIIE